MLDDSFGGMSVRLINQFLASFIVSPLVTAALLVSPAAAQTPLTREVIDPSAAATPVPLPLSAGIRVGDFIYVSGQVELNSPDITGQTTSALNKVRAVVEAAGATMANVDKCTVFLTRQADFAPMNEVWTTWVDTKNMPARACIEAKLADPKALVEIMVVAAK